MFEIPLLVVLGIFYLATIARTFQVLDQIDGMRSFKLPSYIIVPIGERPGHPSIGGVVPTYMHHNLTTHGFAGSVALPVIGLIMIISYFSPVAVNAFWFWVIQCMMLVYPIWNHYLLWRWQLKDPQQLRMVGGYYRSISAEERYLDGT